VPAKGARANGLTMVELLIVLAILSTITAMAVSIMGSAIDDAKVARAVGDLRTMETKFPSMKSSMGRYQIPLQISVVRTTTTLGATPIDI